MDIEIHYYINFLLAMKAGFDPNDAFKIAYSGQYIDDNMNIYKIHDSNHYTTITQTSWVHKSNELLDSIYPIFHFVPGEEKECRELHHPLITTPGNSRVTQGLRYSISIGNVHMIGIASHAFLDSWAHQNFTGTFDPINSVYPFPDFSVFPKIGHMDVHYLPDKINVKWKDHRLMNNTVDNNERFIDAIKSLLLEYTRCTRGKRCSRHLSKSDIGFIDEIKKIWQQIQSMTSRIDMYDQLAFKHFLVKIRKYNKYAWLDEVSHIDKSNLLSIQKSDFYMFHKAVENFRHFLLNNMNLGTIIRNYRA